MNKSFTRYYFLKKMTVFIYGKEEIKTERQSRVCWIFFSVHVRSECFAQTLVLIICVSNTTYLHILWQLSSLSRTCLWLAQRVCKMGSKQLSFWRLIKHESDVNCFVCFLNENHIRLYIEWMNLPKTFLFLFVVSFFFLQWESLTPRPAERVVLFSMVWLIIRDLKRSHFFKYQFTNIFFTSFS